MHEQELRKLYVNVDATNIMVYKIKIPSVKIHDELNVRLLSHWHCALYAKKKFKFPLLRRQVSSGKIYNAGNSNCG